MSISISLNIIFGVRAFKILVSFLMYVLLWTVILCKRKMRTLIIVIAELQGCVVQCSHVKQLPYHEPTKDSWPKNAPRHSVGWNVYPGKLHVYTWVLLTWKIPPLLLCESLNQAADDWWFPNSQGQRGSAEQRRPKNCSRNISSILGSWAKRIMKMCSIWIWGL